MPGQVYEYEGNFKRRIYQCIRSNDFHTSLLLRLGWITDHKIDQFLVSEAEKIESKDNNRHVIYFCKNVNFLLSTFTETGFSDIPPSMLHKHIAFIEQQAPECGRVHQLR